MKRDIFDKWPEILKIRTIFIYRYHNCKLYIFVGKKENPSTKLSDQDMELLQKWKFMQSTTTPFVHPIRQHLTDFGNNGSDSHVQKDQKQVQSVQSQTMTNQMQHMVLSNQAQEQSHVITQAHNPSQIIAQAAGPSIMSQDRNLQSQYNLQTTSLASRNIIEAETVGSDVITTNRGQLPVVSHGTVNIANQNTVNISQSGVLPYATCAVNPQLGVLNGQPQMIPAFTSSQTFNRTDSRPFIHSTVSDPTIPSGPESSIWTSQTIANLQAKDHLPSYTEALQAKVHAMCTGQVAPDQVSVAPTTHPLLVAADPVNVAPTTNPLMVAPDQVNVAPTANPLLVPSQSDTMSQGQHVLVQNKESILPFMPHGSIEERSQDQALVAGPSNSPQHPPADSPEQLQGMGEPAQSLPTQLPHNWLSQLTKGVSRSHIEDLTLAQTPRGTGGGYGVGLDLDAIVRETMMEVKVVDKDR